MMVGVSPASVTPSAQRANSATLCRDSVSARQRPADSGVTPAGSTSTGWMSLVARPAPATPRGPCLGQSVTLGQGGAAASPALEGDGVMDVWRDPSTSSRITLSSACPVTVIRRGQ